MNVAIIDVETTHESLPQHLTHRVRDTKCRVCHTLFDNRDIRDGVCLWCLYDAGNIAHPTLVNERKPIKLTANDVRDIFLRRRAGERIAELAKCYGVSKSMVKAIVYGRLWTHITAAYREGVAS